MLTIFFNIFRYDSGCWRWRQRYYTSRDFPTVERLIGNTNLFPVFCQGKKIFFINNFPGSNLIPTISKVILRLTTFFGLCVGQKFRQMKYSWAGYHCMYWRKFSSFLFLELPSKTQNLLSLGFGNILVSECGEKCE